MPPVSDQENSEVPSMQPHSGERSYGGRSELATPSIARQISEREWLSTDLSTETKCRVLITGEVGTDEIDVLIEWLKMQKRIREKKRSAETNVIDQAPEESGKA